MANRSASFVDPVIHQTDWMLISLCLIILLILLTAAEKNSSPHCKLPDISYIKKVAQERWFKPDEILHIIKNRKELGLIVSNEAPQNPSSGSFFLINRKMMRNFRKDGHEWKKKRGRNVTAESHEKLNVSIDDHEKAKKEKLLNCYYAHGEQNQNFQRRIYWMLQEDLSYITFVHYREVKETVCNLEVESSSHSVHHEFGYENRELGAPEELQGNGKYFKHLKVSKETIPNLEIREPEDPGNRQYTGSLNNQQEPENESAQSGDVRDDLFLNSSGGQQELNNLQVTAEESLHRECNVTKDGQNLDTSSSIPLHAYNDQLAGLNAILIQNREQGEVDISTKNILDNARNCHTPAQAGRDPLDVNFYARPKFENQVDQVPYTDTINKCGDIENIDLFQRFIKFVCVDTPYYNTEIVNIVSPYVSDIHALLKENNDNNPLLRPTLEEVKEQFLQKCLKEKLGAWLTHIAAEGGKGVCALDENGQGVLHLAAALGYDWVIKAIICVGVDINFPDVNGWTALHWAAHCGSKHTVEFLINHGADPKVQSYQTLDHPSSKTPANLASAKGNASIVAYLAQITCPSSPN